MHSVRFTAFLLFALLLPFLARLGDDDWEAYPAVLLPTGTMALSDTAHHLKFGFHELYALDRDSCWRKIDPMQFLQPLPYRFWEYIVGSDFNHSFDSTMATPPAAAHKRDRWLIQNLRRQGLNATQIKVVVVVLVVSPRSGELIQKKMLYERIFHLQPE